MNSTDPVDRLTVHEARTLLKEIREILWPTHDPDEQWSPDTLVAIGDMIVQLRPAPRPAQPRATAPDGK